MPQIEFTIPRLHTAQEYVLSNARRFTSVVCGRRWGKTVLIRELALLVLEGKRIALFAPEFKDVSETWESLETIFKRLQNETRGFCKVDNTHRTIHITANGQTFDEAPAIEFWSLANDRKKDSGRGRKYDVVMYEETQKIETNVLEYHWNKVARATLTDRSGSAWFFGTPPNSRSHFFYDMIVKGARNNPDLQNAFDLNLKADDKVNNLFYTFRMGTHTNPHISASELQLIRDDLPELIYQQEYEAICVEYAEQPFAIALQDKETQARVFTNEIAVVPNAPLYFSFDFNKNPMACVLFQKAEDNRYIYAIREFGAPHGQKVSIHNTCEQIRTWILQTLKRHPRDLEIYITGDATGNTSDPRQLNGATFYQIICEELGISLRQLRLFKRNPPHAESFLHLNTYLSLHPNFRISTANCPRLRADLLSAQADAERGIDKKAYDPHYLDCLRYFLEAFTPRKYVPPYVK